MPQPNENDPRLIQIAWELLRRTRRGEIEWEQASLLEEMEFFSYSTEHFTIKIRSKDSVKGFHVEMSVQDSNGAVLATLRTDKYGEDEKTLALERLFSIVRSQVLQVDDKLNRLLAELGLEEG